MGVRVRHIAIHFLEAKILLDSGATAALLPLNMNVLVRKSHAGSVSIQTKNRGQMK
jgi:hypothetical protein